MFQLSVPWWELAVRAAAVYVFLLLFMRLMGKKHVGQISSFDLVLLLILSNAVENSMIGGDNSLVAGIISASVLIAINYVMSYVTFKSNRMQAIIQGRPKVLIHNGHLYEDVASEAHLTHHEISAALRQQGCGSINDVHAALLENNGAISVVQRKNS
jgi:uncharacterized membrane protein YcaP (DUF421 family)